MFVLMNLKEFLLGLEEFLLGVKELMLKDGILFPPAFDRMDKLEFHPGGLLPILGKKT